MLRALDTILKDPDKLARFATAQDKLVPDPIDYSSWFDQAPEKQRLQAVGPRRYNVLQNKLARQPQYADFLDQETGGLVPLDELEREVPEAFDARRREVDQLLQRRRRQIRQIATLGFEIPPAPPKPPPRATPPPGSPPAPKGLSPQYWADLIKRAAAGDAGAKAVVGQYSKAAKPAEKPAAKKDAPRPRLAPAGLLAKHGDAFERAFKKLDTGRNLVSMLALRSELGLAREEFDALVFELRRAGRFTASALEGRFDLSKEEVAAAIREDAGLLGHLSRRRAG